MSVFSHCWISGEKIHKGRTLTPSEIFKDQFFFLPPGLAALFIYIRDYFVFEGGSSHSFP